MGNSKGRLYSLWNRKEGFTRNEIVGSATRVFAWLWVLCKKKKERCKKQIWSEKMCVNAKTDLSESRG